MNYKVNLTLILSLLTFVSYGQTTTTFITQLKHDSLPICIDYSYDEQVYFGAIYHTDTIVVKDDDTTYTGLEDVYEKNDNYQKDESLILAKDFVKQHLLPDTKFIYTLDDKNKDTLWAEPIDDYLNSNFNAIGLILTTKSFYGVLYERLFSTGGIPSSEKFICTFSKSGKFISRTLIASFVFSGTGFSISGERVPWFPDEHGCVGKDMTINFTSPIHGEKKYKIQTDGKIVETK